MSKTKKIIWIILFMAVLVLPTTFSLAFGKYVGRTNRENRTIAEKPELSVTNFESIKHYPEKYEEYYNDTLPFRGQLITFNNSIDFFVFKKSSSDFVTIGNDGWLFYSRDDGWNPIKQSLGESALSEEELKIIANNLMQSKAALEKDGIEFVLFIAPNKETIYKDKIPVYFKRISDYTEVDQLVNYLNKNTDIRIVYPKDTLMNARKVDDSRLYYRKLDTHWNKLGGYIASRDVAEELGVSLPEDSELKVKVSSRDFGDLTDMLSIKIKNGDLEYKISGYAENKVEILEEDFATKYVLSTVNQDDRKLLVRRDSYADAIYPYLGSLFNESVFIHSGVFTNQDIIDEKPDIFIYETVERYIRTLLDFNCSEIADK